MSLAFERTCCIGSQLCSAFFAHNFVANSKQPKKKKTTQMQEVYQEESHSAQSISADEVTNVDLFAPEAHADAQPDSSVRIFVKVTVRN